MNRNHASPPQEHLRPGAVPDPLVPQGAGASLALLFWALASVPAVLQAQPLPLPDGAPLVLGDEAPLWARTLPGRVAGGPVQTPEGLWVLTGEDRHLWRLEASGRVLERRPLPDRPEAWLAVTPEGRLIFATQDRQLQVWDAAGQPLWSRQLSRRLTQAPVRDSRGRLGWAEGRSWIQVSPEGAPRLRWDLGEEPAAWAADADGRLYSAGRRLEAWDSAGRRLWAVDLPGPARQLLISGDGQIGVLGSAGGATQVSWWSERGRQLWLRPLPGESPVSFVAAQDGSLWVQTDRQVRRINLRGFVEQAWPLAVPAPGAPPGAADAQGRYWAAAANELWVFRPGQAPQFRARSPRPYSRLVLGRESQLLTATEHWVLHAWEAPGEGPFVWSQVRDAAGWAVSRRDLPRRDQDRFWAEDPGYQVTRAWLARGDRPSYERVLSQLEASARQGRLETEHPYAPTVLLQIAGLGLFLPFTDPLGSDPIDLKTRAYALLRPLARAGVRQEVLNLYAREPEESLRIAALGVLAAAGWDGDGAGTRALIQRFDRGLGEREARAQLAALQAWGPQGAPHTPAFDLLRRLWTGPHSPALKREAQSLWQSWLQGRGTSEARVEP